MSADRLRVSAATTDASLLLFQMRVTNHFGCIQHQHPSLLSMVFWSARYFTAMDHPKLVVLPSPISAGWIEGRANMVAIHL